MTEAFKACEKDKKILVDGMLKNVAKLLRIMGYDVEVFEGGNFEEFLRKEGAIFITARKGVKDVFGKKLIFVEEGEPREWVCAKVVKEVGWDEQMYLSRCLLCGTKLQKPFEIPQEILKMKIPHETVVFCPKCEKYFWEGTHHERMRRKVDSVLFLSGVRFEKYKREFLDEITDLYMLCYKGMEEYGERTRGSARRYIKWLSKNSTLFEVVFSSEKIVGFVVACADWWDWEGEKVGEIHEICVHPEHQGKALGKVLMWRAQKHLANEGMRKIGLWVGEKNYRAIKFYHSLGFRILGKFFRIWLRMEKELK